MNSLKAGDLKRHRAHYDVTVMHFWNAITWTNAGILLIRPLGTNFSENRVKIQFFLHENALENVVCEMAAILYRGDDLIHLSMFQIKWSVLKDYIKAGGLGYMSLLMIFFLIYVVSMVATNLWLSAWSDDPYDPSEAGIKRTRLRLGLYGVFGAIQSRY